MPPSTSPAVPSERGIRCPSCRERIPATAKFCPECGSALRADRASSPGERRQLTVFFADLVDSTGLTERWDPEEFQDLVAEYQAICAAVTRRYEGHIAHYLGDGVVAFFGYPSAHEDDAIRAVHSGLEIVERVRKLRVHGERVHLRVAIHTGLVVVGDVGGQDRGEQMVLGEVPNIAARLQAEAEPDTVLISEATRKLVRGHFELEDGGPRTLRGLSRAVQVYKVVGNAASHTRFEAIATADLTPLTGRDREVEQIRGLWERAREGHGEALLLTGEAGIGKSRLLGVALETARLSAREVYSAQCSPYHTNTAFFPLVQITERRLGLTREQSVDEKLSLLEGFVRDRGQSPEEAVPLLAPLGGLPVGDRYPPVELSPARRRQRILEIMTELFLHSPDGSPLLILIEDLHWADPSTLDLVGMLTANCERAPALVALTTRQDPLEVPALAASCSIIQVEPLPAKEIETLVSRVVGGKRLPQSVIREITARTGGVPLFAEAVTRTILESGFLTERADGYELERPLPSGLIPPTVHDSLMARIDALGPHKSVAQLAATIGREFSVELLATLAGRDEEELRAALDRMVALDLVAPASGSSGRRYVFAHALIQDAAYESLLRKTRQDYHRSIAELLLERSPEMAETTPEVLARHFEGAGDIDRAIDYWMAAGSLAQQRSVEREAVAYLKKAVSLLETLPEESPERIGREMAAQLALGPALMATQGWGSGEVEAVCTRALELCDRTGNAQGTLAALWGLWTVLFVRGELDRALEAAQSVLAMAVASENPLLQVAARHGVGFTLYFRGEFAAAREQAEKALELFDIEQERALVKLFQIPSSVCCLGFLTQSLWCMGYPDQAKQRHQELEELVEALDNPACTAVGLGVGMYYDLDRRDPETIAPKAERGYTLSVEEGFLFWAAAMRMYRGWAASLRGDVAGGLPELREGLEEYTLTGSRLGMSAMLLMLAEAQRADGQLQAALEAIDAAIESGAERNERYYEAELHRLKGELQVESGQEAAGELSLRRALEVARAQDARLLELRSANALARLLVDRGQGDEAANLLRPLLDWFSEGQDARELREAGSLLRELEPTAASEGDRSSRGG